MYSNFSGARSASARHVDDCAAAISINLAPNSMISMSEEELCALLNAILDDAGIHARKRSISVRGSPKEDEFILEMSGEVSGLLGIYLLSFANVVYRGTVCILPRRDAERVARGWRMIEQARRVK